MGFYSKVILPRGIEWAMSQPPFPEYRQQLLAEVSGEVLEIGFGTGLNLPHYPQDNIEKLTTIDANPGMSKIARKRVEAAKITVDHRVLNGEKLPMADDSFDSVVSTWTLCSIKEVERAIAEIHRVLKPGGKFFFIEHGLSKDPQIQVWQNFLNPLQKIIADGCHLNRNIRELVTKKFNNNLTLEEFYADKISKYLGYTYKGIAIKN